MKRKHLTLFCALLGSAILYLLYDMNYDILLFAMEKRLEKVLAMVLVGISTSISTVAFQSIASNRILTPGVLGFDTLYITFQLLLVIMFGSNNGVFRVPVVEFFMAASLLVIFSSVFYKWVLKRFNSIYFLVLVGIVMSTFFTSINGMLQIMMSPDVFNLLMDRLFANFSTINKELILLSCAINLIIAYKMYQKHHVLDVISFGKSYSINLGVDYDKEVNRLLVLIFTLVAIATALVGPVSFLGFFAANITVNYLKDYRHKYLISATCMVSIIVLFIGQFLVEHLFDFGLPVSILIGLLGGSYFVALLIKENHV